MADVLADSWIHILPSNASISRTIFDVVTKIGYRTADFEAHISVNYSKMTKSESSSSLNFS